VSRFGEADGAQRRCDLDTDEHRGTMGEPARRTLMIGAAIRVTGGGCRVMGDARWETGGG
jgi:hypothetical protein